MAKSQATKSASPIADNRFERHPRLTLSVILLGSLGLCLFGAEMLARWAHPLDTGNSFEYRIPHPRFGWVLMPGASYINQLPEESVPVSYNSGGWRDLPHTQEKPEGVGRILVLGDSFMEAYSVRFEDALPARLEQLLSTAERPVEVINFGVGGYGTLQEYLVYNAFGPAYQPDVVVLAMYLANDLVDNSLELSSMSSKDWLKVKARPFLDPQVSEWRVTQVDFEGSLQRYEENRRMQAEPLNRLLRNSALLQLGQRALELQPQRWWWKGSPSKEAPSASEKDLTKSAKYEESWDVTRRILTRLNGEVRAAGAHLLVMSVPDSHEIDEMGHLVSDAPQTEPTAYQHLKKLLRELDVDYLDLLPAFREAKQESGIELFRRSDHHWNPQGHALAARELAAALKLRGYLAWKEPPKLLDNPSRHSLANELAR